jgi:hypothetical protein
MTHPTPLPMPSVLQEAENIVSGDRNQDYGSAIESFERTAVIATMTTGKHLTAADCCKVLMAVKLTRESYKPKRDNLVDLAGYTLILDKITEATRNETPVGAVGQQVVK